MLCDQSIQKIDSVLIDAANVQRACYPCFKNNKMLFKIQQGFKQEMYCERCKYKFSSKSLVCPYCSKGDRIVKGNMTVRDIL